MEYSKCPECGQELQGEIGSCPDCGLPVKPELDSTTEKVNNSNKKNIGILMCIIGLICCIFAFTRINSDDYDFYLEHYEDCMEGYQEAIGQADSYSGYFNIAYENIADEYKKMADADYIEIWKLRSQLIIPLGIGIILLLLGYYNIKTDQTDEIKKKRNIIVVGSIVVVVLVCIVWYQTDKNSINNSSYSSYTYNNDYDYDSYSNDGYSYDYTKTGREGAVDQAKSYLRSSAFSYTGLIDQLEYEGYTNEEATYGADNCGANWKEQALRNAESYLDSSGFSYEGLLDQLQYEGYTEEEAKYGVDNCSADWMDEAVETAASYLRSSSFSRSELIDQLEYEGFSYEQAVYGVEQNGL